MKVRIVSNVYNELCNPIEIVERKGAGHPDTLADLVAAYSSNLYSRLCREKFGVIPPHWLDKVVLAGAKSNVSYGTSQVLLPIRAYLFGKTTKSIGGEPINDVDIFIEAVRHVFLRVFRSETILDHILYEFAVHDGYGPDHPKGFYDPASVNDVLTMLTGLRANDTSVVTAFAGYSPAEVLAIEVENYLNSDGFKARYPETGTDVKVMIVREDDTITITACIPFIGSRTPSFAFYSEKLRAIRHEITDMAEKAFPNYRYELFTNTKDTGERAFLTAYGSALDKGDCGAVGRGNRYNGIITPQREMSIEAAAGKNPTHHVGKLYSELALRIAKDLFLQYHAENAVNIVSHNGDDLRSPSRVIVRFHNHVQPTESEVMRVINFNLEHLPEMVIEMIYSDPINEHINKPRQLYPDLKVAS